MRAFLISVAAAIAIAVIAAVALSGMHYSSAEKHAGPDVRL